MYTYNILLLSMRKDFSWIFFAQVLFKFFLNILKISFKIFPKFLPKANFWYEYYPRSIESSWIKSLSWFH